MTSSLIELKERLQLHFYHRKFYEDLRVVFCIICYPLCCCWYCCLESNCLKLRGETRPEKQKRRQEYMSDLHFKHQRRKNGRRQSLSIGAPNTSIGTWTTKPRKKPFSDQRQSILFSKLPAEIREKIYEYALLDTRGIFWHLNERLGKRPLLESTPCLPTSGFSVAVGYYIHTRHYKSSFRTLLQTCRLVYTEALPLLYCNTQFVFDGDSAFFAFASTAPTAKLQMIRSARIDYNHRKLHQWTPRSTHIESWGNLRSLYLVYPDSDDSRWSHALSVINEAAKIKNCVFHVLEFLDTPRDPIQLQNFVPVELSTHLVVDPTNDPDWRIPFNNGY